MNSAKNVPLIEERGSNPQCEQNSVQHGSGVEVNRSERLDQLMEKLVCVNMGTDSLFSGCYILDFGCKHFRVEFDKVGTPSAVPVVTRVLSLQYLLTSSAPPTRGTVFFRGSMIRGFSECCIIVSTVDCWENSLPHSVEAPVSWENHSTVW